MTYAVVSDLHCHAWSSFSKTNPDGVNSRLRITLNELKRAATELKAAGGSALICGGDIFHVRGSVDPEVLNPVQDMIREILEMEIDIFAIPGNHDLKGQDTTRLGSAIQTLAETHSGVSTFRVYNEPSLTFGIAFVPYRPTSAALLRDIEGLAKEAGSAIDQVDLFIHAGIDGVLSGMPDHGLTADILGKFGFRRVFAGDYHNHKALDHGVYSIGATSHHTWRDIGSKAGFLLVDNKEVRFFDTHAPKFVDVTGMTEDDIKLVADGNYVRFRGEAMTMQDQNELRDFFIKCGALGTSLQVPKAVVNQRTGKVLGKSSLTVDQSIEAYVDAATDIPAHVNRMEVKRKCGEALSKARSVYEDA